MAAHFTVQPNHLMDRTQWTGQARGMFWNALEVPLDAPELLPSGSTKMFNDGIGREYSSWLYDNEMQWKAAIEAQGGVW